MKILLIVAVLAALAVSDEAAVVKASSRTNLDLGYLEAGDRLLFRTNVYQPARPNTIQYQDVIFRGNTTKRITAIQVNEVGVTQYATPTIIGGGVGANNVTIRLTSYRGYGYNYMVYIWGR